MFLAFLRHQCDALIKTINGNIARFSKKSNDAMYGLKKELGKLQRVNSAIDENVAVADAQLTSVTDLKKQLLDRKAENSRVVDQINSVLGAK